MVGAEHVPADRECLLVQPAGGHVVAVLGGKRPEVVEHRPDIVTLVEERVNIPIHTLSQSESATLLHLEDDLHRRIIGQEEAIKTVCRAIRRSRADIKDPNRPIGAFMFLGPTGVGKTLLARLLAINLFGGEDALIQVDMSEYMEKFAVSRMTGSPQTCTRVTP